MHETFGPIALLGSGETSLAGGRIFENVIRNLEGPLRVAVVETPAGFELNSYQVARKVADYMQVRLQNYRPEIAIVAARKQGTAFSPEAAEVVAPLLSANLIFMGPGSPTYAVRQLKGSLAWEIIRARHRMGAALVFASAATIAVGARVLPVYEIYKAGEEVTCPPGLGLFADFGLELSCIPHWNNTDGGEEVDTSRCFMGMERFAQWCELVPAGQPTLGLDEHTGIVIDFASGMCTVTGVSSVTVNRACNPEIFPTGSQFGVSELGEVRCPESPQIGIREDVWEMVSQAKRAPERLAPPEDVMALVAARQEARDRKDWAQADEIRRQVTALGWSIMDSAAGQELVRL